MAPFPWRLVSVDIDGTLTLVHGWREIAVTFGRLDGFDRTNRQFRSHEIGEDQHLANLLDLAAGHTVREVESVVAQTPKLAGIAEGIGELHGRGCRVALLTHNPTYVADWYRRTYGFDDSEAVKVPPLDGGRIGRSGPVHADKPGGMRALLTRLSVDARLALHVGDGLSDAEVFREVGGGVALNSPYPEVDRAASLALSTKDFRDVVAGIARIAPRE